MALTLLAACGGQSAEKRETENFSSEAEKSSGSESYQETEMVNEAVGIESGEAESLETDAPKN